MFDAKSILDALVRGGGQQQRQQDDLASISDMLKQLGRRRPEPSSRRFARRRLPRTGAWPATTTTRPRSAPRSGARQCHGRTDAAPSRDAQGGGLDDLLRSVLGGQGGGLGDILGKLQQGGG